MGEPGAVRDAFCLPSSSELPLALHGLKGLLKAYRGEEVHTPFPAKLPWLGVILSVLDKFGGIWSLKSRTRDIDAPLTQGGDSLT